MEYLRFQTRISEDRTIKIPPSGKILNGDVDVVIFPKPERKETSLSIEDFIKKWSGFLSDTSLDDVKLDYLKEKYQ